MLRSELKTGDLFMYIVDDDDMAGDVLFRVVSPEEDFDVQDKYGAPWDTASNPHCEVIRLASGTFTVGTPSGSATLPQPQGSGDPVHPQHYKGLTPEPFDVIDAWGLGYYRGTTIKYVSRAGHKDPAKFAEDMRKAAAYCERAAKAWEAGRRDGL